ADAAVQRRAPKAPAFPVVVDGLLEQLVDERLVADGCEQVRANRAPAVEMPPQHRFEQLVLALEARIESADRVAGFGRDLGDRNFVEFALLEELECRLDDRVVSLLTTSLFDSADR